MSDKLMEQIIKTVDYAVEERAMLFGPHYASSLEGYGDVHRQMVGVMDSMKDLKSQVGDLVGYVNNTDANELNKALTKLEDKSRMLAYEALRMCETVARYMRTIKDKSGGDLLDLLEGKNEPEDDEEE